MNTTLRIKIAVKSSAGAKLPEAAPLAPDSGTGGSTAPREFLAMRARQKQADAKARRWRLGLLAVGVVAASGLALTRWPAGSETATAAMTVAAQPTESVQKELASAPTAAPFVAGAAIAETDAEAMPGTGPIPTATAVSTEAAAASDSEPCASDFGSQRWRSAIDSCGLAFDASPGPVSALRIAHSHWSRGEIRRAGAWANKAIELGTEDADAFVLVGHAEQEAGNPNRAAAAFRRYLKASPRGWHARKVRAALRDLKPRLTTETAELPTEFPLATKLW